MASMFLAVSMNVSPLERLLLEAVKSSVSAPSRRAARAKLVLVRVEFSKNRLQQVLPAGPRSFGPPVIEHAAENGRLVENQRDFLGRKVFQSQQVPPRPERRDLAQFFQNGRFGRHASMTSARVFQKRKMVSSWAVIIINLMNDASVTRVLILAEPANGRGLGRNTLRPALAGLAGTRRNSSRRTSGHRPSAARIPSGPPCGR